MKHKHAELIHAWADDAKIADDLERKEYEALGDPRVPQFKSLIGNVIRARSNRTKSSKDICDND